MEGCQAGISHCGRSRNLKRRSFWGAPLPRGLAMRVSNSAIPPKNRNREEIFLHFHFYMRADRRRPNRLGVTVQQFQRTIPQLSLLVFLHNNSFHSEVSSSTRLLLIVILRQVTSRRQEIHSRRRRRGCGNLENSAPPLAQPPPAYETNVFYGPAKAKFFGEIVLPYGPEKQERGCSACSFYPEF